MFCLLEPCADQEKGGDFDAFAEEDEETNSNCYYIDFIGDDGQV